ncbi:MAG: NUDIX hydrolase [Alteromonadaceae bacterium]|nr:NUDIX hydrolase [Alteromonadaceae bacterium]MBH85601.1 NUDIX hydrolase [Alteromonadaceae bacterium]|tara:strand:+ start:7646 stop:8101 length:456 start_codon:yes stop_codon:yes gene_type:complete
MTWKPHATVAVVVEQDGRFLMVEEHSDGRVVYNQPAGHIEQHESILNAARRETLEETGWQVEPTDFMGLYTFEAPNGATYYRLCFAAKAIEHISDTLDDDIIAAHWLSYDEICERRQELRSPLVINCIDDYLAGKRYPLEIITDKIGMDAN